MMRLSFNRVRKFLRALTDAHVYTAWFWVGRGFTLPDSVSPRAFNGLIGLQVFVDETRDGWLATTWANRDAFRAAADRLLKELRQVQRGSYVRWVARQDQLAVHHPPWWKRPGLVWQAIVHGVALLGFLEVLRNHYEYFLGAPEVDALVSSQPLDCIVDEPFTVELPVRNVSRAGPCHMRVEKIQFVANNQPTADVQLIPEGRQVFPLVSPGITENVRISGRPLKTGDFTVKATVSVQAGRWKRPEQFELTRAIRVWKDRDTGKPRLLDWKSNEAEFAIQVHAARPHPKGLVGLVQLTGARIVFVRTSAIALQRHENPTYNDTGARPISTVEFQTATIPNPIQFDVRVRVSSVGAMDEQQWRDVGLGTHVTLQSVVP
jgi:hypothetical protein